MIKAIDRYRFISAFATLFERTEDEIAKLVKQNGLQALIDAPNDLLETPIDEERFQALLRLLHLDEFNLCRQERLSLSGPDDAYGYILNCSERLGNKDFFLSIYLDARNNVMGEDVYQMESTKELMPSRRDILFNAIKKEAVNFITARCVSDEIPDFARWKTKYKRCYSELKNHSRMLGIPLLDCYINNYSVTMQRDVNEPSMLQYQDSQVSTEERAEIMKERDSAYATLLGIPQKDVRDRSNTITKGETIDLPLGRLTVINQKKKQESLRRLIQMAGLIRQETSKIESAACAARYIRAMGENLHLQEAVCAIYLDDENHVLHYDRKSLGPVNYSVIDPKLIFRTAFEYDSSRIILGHNHPSGEVTPSQSDKDAQNAMEEISQLFDIEIVDHVIVSGIDSRHFSFSEAGMLSSAVMSQQKRKEEYDHER